MILVMMQVLLPFAVAAICALMVVHVVHAVVPGMALAALCCVALAHGIRGLYVWSVTRGEVRDGR